MKFLHIMRSVNPEGGGPIEALVQSNPVWRRYGHSREIVSLDAAEDSWVSQCPILTHAMGSPAIKRFARHAPLLRYGFTSRLVPWLRAHVAEYDVVVVNGLWNFADLAARCVLPFQPRPYFVFAHGMLDPWFRRAHPVKHFAKQLSWWLCEGPLLRGAQAVLFTSEGEKEGATGAFWPYRLNARVSGYGIATAPPRTAVMNSAFQAAVPELGGRPYLLFLGRLHPKKGCDLLLRAFGRVAAQHPDFHLVVGGPDAGCRHSLEALAKDRGIEARVHWPGMLRGDAKWGALHGCEAFVLPSHGENFGVAVVEAMACGRPVLISDRVNLAPRISADGAGIVEPDTLGGTADLLTRFLALSREGRDGMGERARSCFLRYFHIDRVAEGALALLAGGSP